MTLKVPARAFNDKVVVGFMNAILGEIDSKAGTLNGLSDVIIVSSTTGQSIQYNGVFWTNVDPGDAVANSNSTVTSADATDLPTVITLANEIKGDVNELTTQFNALLASLRAANVIKT